MLHFLDISWIVETIGTRCGVKYFRLVCGGRIRLRGWLVVVDVGRMSAGQGSAGNVIAALCSLLFPGLGQLVQGRFLAAVIFAVGMVVAWIFLLGWVVHLWACLNAALWRPR